jgi:D-alanyl-lipoteichoic acid acyltransferase DltB (MBOAT superfamily)
VEFWRRWHISLSQWFQDYLYYPLAMRYMRQGGWASKYRAHIIAMGLIGLWHGANWTFIVFGLYWGVLIALYLYSTERLAAMEQGPMRRAWSQLGAVRTGLSMLLMFGLVCVGWVFFRANSIASAWHVLSRMFSSVGAPTVLRVDVASTALLWALVIGLWLAEWQYQRRTALIEGLAAKPWTAMAWRYALIVAILFSYTVVQQGVAQPFIYFQF